MHTRRLVAFICQVLLSSLSDLHPLLSRLRPEAFAAATAACAASESVAAAARAESAAIAVDELRRDLERAAAGLSAAEEGLERFPRMAEELELWAEAARMRVDALEWEEAAAAAEGDEEAEERRMEAIKVSCVALESGAARWFRKGAMSVFWLLFLKVALVPCHLNICQLCLNAL